MEIRSSIYQGYLLVVYKVDPTGESHIADSMSKGPFTENHFTEKVLNSKFGEHDSREVLDYCIEKGLLDSVSRSECSKCCTIYYHAGDFSCPFCGNKESSKTTSMYVVNPRFHKGTIVLNKEDGEWKELFRPKQVKVINLLTILMLTSLALMLSCLLNAVIFL